MAKRTNDAQWKNQQWTINQADKDPGAVATVDEAILATLMDIRGELQALNRVFGCSNFLRIPWVLDRIAANTRKPRKRRKAKA